MLLRGSDAAGTPADRGLGLRLLRHVGTGLVVGSLVGYLVALLLPRRHRAPAGTYLAPIPPQRGVDLDLDLDLRTPAAEPV
jgi:hypothetical protein